jgi:CheY-like chemotaxis protein
VSNGREALHYFAALNDNGQGSLKRASANYSTYLARSTKPTEALFQMPDIILMDVQMPYIDGYKCTHILRQHTPYKGLMEHVPIVAMTASAVQGDREKCIAAGMNDYLCKPIRVEAIERALIRWCGDAAEKGPSPVAALVGDDVRAAPHLCSGGHEEVCWNGEGGEGH